LLEGKLFFLFLKIKIAACMLGLTIKNAHCLADDKR
jgi:hypothetical protein